jgi:N-acetylglucosamine malate deacetylase 2
MWYRDEHSVTSGSAAISLRPAAPARIRRAARPPGPASAIRAVPQASAGEPLPSARRVVAITARPGQESADLGALLYAFSRRGARVALLCLTRGEASPLNATSEPLEAVRPWELQVAAGLLGISSVRVSDYPDGGLRLAPVPALTARVRSMIREHAPDLLLVVDPAASGDADDARVAKAACLAAESAGLPVAARTAPGARGSWPLELGADATVGRAIQLSAVAAHASQSAALPRLRRRLDLQTGPERLRWLWWPPGV